MFIPAMWKCIIRVFILRWNPISLLFRVPLLLFIWSRTLLVWLMLQRRCSITAVWWLPVRLPYAKLMKFTTTWG